MQSSLGGGMEDDTQTNSSKKDPSEDAANPERGQQCASPASCYGHYNVHLYN